MATKLASVANYGVLASSTECRRRCERGRPRAANRRVVHQTLRRAVVTAAR